MEKTYINTYDAFGDEVEMTFKDYQDLCEQFPDWELEKDLFSERHDGVYYDDKKVGALDDTK